MDIFIYSITLALFLGITIRQTIMHILRLEYYDSTFYGQGNPFVITMNARFVHTVFGKYRIEGIKIERGIVVSGMVGLSKSRYCKGIQCSKILWMDKNKPELAEDTASEQVLANGDKVGELARECFGEYSLVEYSADKAAMCKQTEVLMEAGAENIAEASFLYNGLYCAVDMLRKNGDGWDIVEVKRSTSVHDIYVEDVMPFSL